jgi:hypothetical protein
LREQSRQLPNPQSFFRVVYLAKHRFGNHSGFCSETGVSEQGEGGRCFLNPLCSILDPFFYIQLIVLIGWFVFFYIHSSFLTSP